MLITKILKSHLHLLMMLIGIISGALVGYYIPALVPLLKPFGQMFLNILLCCIVPFIFFNIAAAIATTKEHKNVLRLSKVMAIVYLIMGLLASIYMLVVLKFFPIALNLHPLSVTHVNTAITSNWTLDELLTTTSFNKLFNHQHILALLVFSILTGFASLRCGTVAQPMVNLLASGAQVFRQLILIIMQFAPFGLFAYFAMIVQSIGPQIIKQYLYVFLIYDVSAIAYFVIIFSLLAVLSGGLTLLKMYWRTVSEPALTALATCSGIACVPVNLAVAEQAKVPSLIANLATPLGMMLHKDGSIMGGMVKIIFVLTLLHIPLLSLTAISKAVIVAMLVGTVMGSIPSGGLIGETLILSCYGFPDYTLMIMAAISVILDPVATMLNVTGNTLATLIINRRLLNAPTN